MHCLATGLPVGQTLTIDAPAPGGPGGGPCPIDLLGRSFAGCVAMVMGMVAGKQNLNLAGMAADMQMELTEAPPRRVASIEAIFTVPAHVPADKLEMLRQAAGMCPVHNSLHPDVKIRVLVVSA
jgi:uncharacterized OsmC-like protein